MPEWYDVETDIDMLTKYLVNLEWQRRNEVSEEEEGIQDRIEALQEEGRERGVGI